MESLLDVVNCIGFSYICLLVYFYLVSLCSICGFKLAEIRHIGARCVQLYCFFLLYLFVGLFIYFVSLCFICGFMFAKNRYGKYRRQMWSVLFFALFDLLVGLFCFFQI